MRGLFSANRSPLSASESSKTVSDDKTKSELGRQSRIADFCKRRARSLGFCLVAQFIVIALLIIFLALAAAGTLSSPRRFALDSGHTVIPTTPIGLAALANFPDPSLYYDDITSTWYAYGSNAGAIQKSYTTPSREASVPAQNLSTDANIQLMTSKDLISFLTHPVDPLPAPGAWTNSTDPRVWAPEVIRHPTSANGNNTYLMYYTAAAASKRRPRVHCVGVASGSSPSGPFTAENSILVCDPAGGGTIDPAPFVEPESGDLYLVSKVDGDSLEHAERCGNGGPPCVDTPIVLHRLLSSGLGVDTAFNATTLLHRCAECGDGPLIEAPSLVKVNSTYVLFYSSGLTFNTTYTVKYATSDAIAGPYQRKGIVLKTGDYDLLSPGSVGVNVATSYGDNSRVGGTVGTSADDWVMVFHARMWTSSGGLRSLFTVGLRLDDDGAVSVVELADV